MTPAKLTWRLPQPFGVKAVGASEAFGAVFRVKPQTLNLLV